MQRLWRWFIVVNLEKFEYLVFSLKPPFKIENFDFIFELNIDKAFFNYWTTEYVTSKFYDPEF